ncbi:MAG TPA: M23 family metallopeptidase [Acidimicrobiales bacterium]|nr:M23 family metallopeptidase [Acidimicrobiales bacterium]
MAAAVCVVGSTCLLTAGPAAAAASGSTTPTTSPAPAPTAAPTTMPTVAPANSTTTTTADGASGSSADQSATTASTSAAGSPQVNYQMLSESEAVRRTGPTSTAPLLAALAQLQRFGLTPVQAAIIGMGQFPVAGLATYGDDFLEYRSFPTPHLHQGIDIVAAEGTPLRSPAAGVLRYSTADPDGYGLTALVVQPDGTYFLLAHMSATVLGLASGASVKQGQVIGFVGASGDATGPHCHFEVHPRGGAATDPKPFLDGALAQAMAQVPALVQAFAGPQQATAPVVTAVPSPAPVPAAPTQSFVASGAVPRRSSKLPYALAAVVALVAGAVAWDVVDRRRLTGPR